MIGQTSRSVSKFMGLEAKETVVSYRVSLAGELNTSSLVPQHGNKAHNFHKTSFYNHLHVHPEY